MDVRIRRTWKMLSNSVWRIALVLLNVLLDAQVDDLVLAGSQIQVTLGPQERLPEGSWHSFVHGQHRWATPQPSMPVREEALIGHKSKAV
jgi:hypothetical protein